MSVDYFLISESKKIIMPFFTMKASGYWQVEAAYAFDLLLEADDLRVISEHGIGGSGSVPWPYEEHGWTYINSYHSYDETHHD